MIEIQAVSGVRAHTLLAAVRVLLAEDTLLTEPTSSEGARAEVAHIDLLLGAQIAVAWAGERGGLAGGGPT